MPPASTNREMPGGTLTASYTVVLTLVSCTQIRYLHLKARGRERENISYLAGVGGIFTDKCCTEFKSAKNKSILSEEPVWHVTIFRYEETKIPLCTLLTVIDVSRVQAILRLTVSSRQDYGPHTE